MKAKLAHGSTKLSASILILLIAIALINVAALSAPPTQPDLFAGITFAGSTNDADRAYLQTSLGFLRDTLPDWYAYIVQAEPFVLSVGQTENADWVAADSMCCDDRGNGMITFEDHFDRVIASSDPSDQTNQAKQVAFLSTLIHEVTHVYDYRAGRIPSKIDAATCIASEGSAYAKEFEFKRAIASANFADARAGELYRRAVEKQLAADEEAFNGNFWKLYCILAHPNIMDD